MPLILDFFLDRMNEYIGILALMLSSFLIGYFSSFWLNKIKYESLIDRLKKKVNSLKMIP